MHDVLRLVRFMIPTKPHPKGGPPSQYRKHLAHERFMYAWCLKTMGQMEAPQARDLARKRYPFEECSNELRELVFHDEAWHWAMLQLFGDGYWRGRPDLTRPSVDYRQTSAAFDRMRDC